MKIRYNLLLFVLVFSCTQEPINTKLSGSVFGTSYSIIYNSEINYQIQIDSLFSVINKSMSTYQTDSDISKLNRNEDSVVDVHFLKVFEASKEIYKQTNGVFDPTIGAVVNAWDFGPEGKIVNLDSLKIDSLMVSVGLDKVKRHDNKIIKPVGTFIDFNAIAKGYGVDVIGEFLESKHIKNYLVEIGGEIRARGENVEKKSLWKIGIEMPHFDNEQSILEAIEIHDEAMATSGTYRKFKVDSDGNRYAHIIDTKTGYPSKTNLLSISVIAEKCMIADAYATAFKAMGIEKVKTFLQTHPELKVFLIFENDKKELETMSLNGFLEV
ncbi:FAD:protein FMN transferase [Mariniflexile litorale]|uniref:FAD:protein FMN transferase n=1 Tax=Mariniflexile litorale TaxID=3045158 RepID=A0AAU7EHY7_9FLAO|nr:FAD:protein FMN transferase [Mariniflexile sp. KMM 9835]MDQ8210148.1 FAD:protein FMN transferase [Mariniflexile sp. KMM 9835]